MNKYYTKEYIKECDSKKIQELFFKKFSEEIDYGSWYFDTERNEIMLASVRFLNRRVDPICCFYLPTGDQLDEEIENVLDKLEEKYGCLDYCISRATEIEKGTGRNYKQWWVGIDGENKFSGSDFEHTNFNPLIAKIKLLKELLNDN